LDFDAGVVHVRRQLRWDSKGRPYFCLPKGGKTRDAPLSPNLAKRVQDHLRRFPSIACTLLWRNPEPPTNELEARQRKPISVWLVLITSQGNRINCSMWNKLSWRPALAAAGVVKKVGEKAETYGGHSRRYPVYELSREDMSHVLRHTYPSTQLEAGESIVSVSEWLGHASPQTTLTHYAHFVPGAGKRSLAAMDKWFDQDPQPIVPKKSPGRLTGPGQAMKPQVRAVIAHTDSVHEEYMSAAAKASCSSTRIRSGQIRRISNLGGAAGCRPSKQGGRQLPQRARS
jgi:hypothetical protein